MVICSLTTHKIWVFFFFFTFSSPNWLNKKYYRHAVVHQVLFCSITENERDTCFFATKHNVLHMFWIIGHLLQPCLRTILLYMKFWRHVGIIHVVEKGHYLSSYITKRPPTIEKLCPKMGHSLLEILEASRN